MLCFISLLLFSFLLQSTFFLLFCLTSVLFLFNFHCGVFILKFCFVQPLFFFFLFICNFCCFYFCCVFSIFHCYVEPWWFLKKLNVQNESDHTEKNCNLKMLATRIGDISSWVITAVTLNQILQSKWQKETRKVIKPWV